MNVIAAIKSALTPLCTTYTGLSSKKHYWLHFMVLTGVMFTYCILQKNRTFYGDAYGYWYIGEFFTKDGVFNFTHYPVDTEVSAALRGYFFPFLLLILKKIAELALFNKKIGAFYLFSSALFAFLCLTIYPKIAALALRVEKIGYKSAYLFAFFVFFFWRGSFLHPLADFPALVFFTLGIIFISKALTGRRLWLHALCAGMFLAAAVNTRPNYLAGILLLPLFFLSLSEPLGKKFKSLGFALCGMLVIFAPQMAISKVYHNTLSPFINTHWVFGEQQSFTAFKLIQGIEQQKYETKINDPKTGAGEVAYYYDPITPKLLEDAGISHMESFGDYIKFVSQYPLDMLIVYVRHFFNAMDVISPAVYIFDFSENRFLFSFLNYFLLFLGLCALWRHLETFKWKQFFTPANILLITAFGLSALGILSAPEVRYALPIYVLIYGVVATDVVLRRERERERERVGCRNSTKPYSACFL